MSEQAQREPRPSNPREPQAYPGGEQEFDAPVPPYPDRGTGEGQDVMEERGGVPGAQAGPRQVSEAEREGVTATEPAPSGPHGVGESTTTSGQDLGGQMSEEAHRADRLDSGIGDEEQITGPAMHPGDQGG
jgi:hypothetical protein